MPESIRLADALPQRLRLAASGLGEGSPRFTLGARALDARLGGGLESAGLHEVHGMPGEEAAASAFAALLACRAASPGSAVLWIRSGGAVRLHGPGLAELGLDPAAVLLVSTPDPLTTLRAAGDVVRCAGVGAVVIEIAGRMPQLDLTATRRLALAAARTGVFAALLRIGATCTPTAARTRWTVAAAPSVRLAGHAPGHPAFDVALTYNRNGHAGFEARLEWDRDACTFHDAPLPGALPAVPADGAAGASGRRAA